MEIRLKSKSETNHHNRVDGSPAKLGLLYPTIAEHWPAFRERAEEASGLPRFVDKNSRCTFAAGCSSWDVFIWSAAPAATAGSSALAATLRIFPGVRRPLHVGKPVHLSQRVLPAGADFGTWLRRCRPAASRGAPRSLRGGLAAIHQPIDWAALLKRVYQIDVLR
jgi:hypothetical protein